MPVIASITGSLAQRLHVPPAAPPGNNFNLIRFALASIVILSHAYPMTLGTEDAEPLMRLSQGQMTLGTLAVDMFFAISGYLISQSWTREPVVRSYLVKRVRRIYPGFLVAAIISAFIVTPNFWGPGSFIDARFVFDFVTHALRLIFLQPSPAFLGNPGPGAVNGSLWSIPYEFWCYLFLMGAGLLGVYARPRLLVALLAFATAVSFAFAHWDLKISGSYLGWLLGYPPFWAKLLPYYVVGMLFYSHRDRIRLTAAGAAIAAVSLLIASRIPHGLIFVLPVAGMYLVLWMARLPMPLLEGLFRRDDYSYGIYLYAFPIAQILTTWIDVRSPALLFVLAWPASIAAGYVSWHVLEKHFLVSSPKRLRLAAG